MQRAVINRGEILNTQLIYGTSWLSVRMKDIRPERGRMRQRRKWRAAEGGRVISIVITSTAICNFGHTRTCCVSTSFYLQIATFSNFTPAPNLLSTAVAAF